MFTSHLESVYSLNEKVTTNWENVLTVLWELDNLSADLFIIDIILCAHMWKLKVMMSYFVHLHWSLGIKLLMYEQTWRISPCTFRKRGKYIIVFILIQNIFSHNFGWRSFSSNLNVDGFKSISQILHRLQSISASSLCSLSSRDLSGSRLLIYTKVHHKAFALKKNQKKLFSLWHE